MEELCLRAVVAHPDSVVVEGECHNSKPASAGAAGITGCCRNSLTHETVKFSNLSGRGIDPRSDY